MHKNDNLRHQLAILSFIVIAVAASACTKKEEPLPAKSQEPVAFKAQTPISVTFTLQNAEGQTGRSSPIGNNYRPQVKFPFGPTETTCAVQLPASAPSLEPGQSASASLVCDTEVLVERGKLEFVATEGGKQVGQGVVQLQ